MASSNETTVGKPFAGFEDFDACVTHFEGDASIDDPREFCGWLQEEGKEALADPNADEVLTSLGVEFVSAVDVPAQDSEWVIAKNAEGPNGHTHRWRSTAEFVIAKNDDEEDTEEKQIAFAPVLIPGEADKQGDIIPDHEIEKAAHDYLAHFRKVDADHDLLDGRGTPVESWTLKRDQSFTKPDGTESRVYPKGSWFMGIRFDDETWSRLKSGELGGLSIYGGAKPIDVDAIKASITGTAADADSTDTASIALSKGDNPDADTMENEPEDGDENTEPATEGGDGVEDAVKNADADTISGMLQVFRELVDDGEVTVDASVEEFVKAILSSGGVEEKQVTGLDVFLSGDGGDDDDYDDEDKDEDEDDDEEAPDLNETDLDMSKNEDGNPETEGTDGGALPDDTPEWAEALSKDVRGSVDEVREDVAEVTERVDELEKKVDDDGSLNERISDDDFEKRFKSFLGVDEDADPEVIRKAVREQTIEKNDDRIDASYSGIVEDDEGATARPGAKTRANSRLNKPGEN